MNKIRNIKNSFKIVIVFLIFIIFIVFQNKIPLNECVIFKSNSFLINSSKNIKINLRKMIEINSNNNLPMLYIITATNSRRETQLADLTRLANTLLLVPNILWIVIEDAKEKTTKINRFLNESGIPNVYLNEESDADLIVNDETKRDTKPRGVLQRNKGINWLRKNKQFLDLNGCVYFADDDNSYDIRLFEEVIFIYLPRNN